MMCRWSRRGSPPSARRPLVPLKRLRTTNSYRWPSGATAATSAIKIDYRGDRDQAMDACKRRPRSCMGGASQGDLQSPHADPPTRGAQIGLHIQADGYVAMGDLLQAPRIWNQWIIEAEIIDVIHYNQKNRFEVSYCDGAYLVRARQGHSIEHIQNELILTRLTVDDTPEFVAHGTYYDFYQSIVRYGLMAGGRQGQSFRRHVHLVEQLPGSDVVSGMRSDCDLVLWISVQSAAVSGITFYRSANDVILTEATIDPAFFHSVQITRSLEVLTADGGPPHPQQVALAISRASSRDAQRHGQYMRVVRAHATVSHRLNSLHASRTRTPVPLPCR